jgi:hypothetical protein
METYGKVGARTKPRHVITPDDITNENIEQIFGPASAAIQTRSFKTSTTFVNGLRIRSFAHEEDEERGEEIVGLAEVGRHEVYDDGDVKIFPGGDEGFSKLVAFLKEHALRTGAGVEADAASKMPTPKTKVIRTMIKAALDQDSTPEELQSSLERLNLAPHARDIRGIASDLVMKKTFENSDGATSEYPADIAKAVALKCFEAVRG